MTIFKHAISIFSTINTLLQKTTDRLFHCHLQPDCIPNVSMYDLSKICLHYISLYNKFFIKLCKLQPSFIFIAKILIQFLQSNTRKRTCQTKSIFTIMRRPYSIRIESSSFTFIAIVTFKA